jgi:hypothetical protein
MVSYINYEPTLAKSKFPGMQIFPISVLGDSVVGRMLSIAVQTVRLSTS